MGSDRRARDILTELATRRSLGERLWERIGRRGWGRPNVAVSDRIYKRFGLADPWDPTSKSRDEKPVGLGPVSLRLGPDRREPAPHLKPKQPKKKGRGSGLPRASAPSPSSSSGGPRFPPGFKPPVGVPSAKTTSKHRPPPEPPKRPATELSKEFGGASGGPRGLVGKLPVRPEIAARMKAEAEAKAAGQPAPKAAPLPKPKPPKPPRPQQRRSRKPRIMQRNPNLPPPEGAVAAAAPAAGAAPPVDRRPPLPSRAQGKRRGRFSMRPTEVTAAPVVTELPDPVVEVVATPEEAAPPAPPPARPKAPVSAGGLDDLFGFAAQEGRMRLGKKKKE